MHREALIETIGEWLVDQALDEPDIIEMFEHLCRKLYGAGVPVARARLTWPTLHPLFRAETILWRRMAETEFEQFRHQDDTSDAWQLSPMAWMFENDVEVLRRNLDGPNRILDFPILEELEAEGMTDYLVIITSFIGERPSAYDEGRGGQLNGAQSAINSGPVGVILNWACDRPGGFSNDDIAALKLIQRRFAVACKSVIQRRIASNITETYLGRQAGREVLDGAIRLGDGKAIEAVVWYADMRNSTALADTMEAADFLDLLNDYFHCTAGPTIEYGGEVLDFIGDAVLAIFPYEDAESRKQAIQCATMAMEDALERMKVRNRERTEAGKTEFGLGIGINTGWLTFGNIGVESRLSFSVIGPTINEVERIETLTKHVKANALVTADIAKIHPDRWHSIGLHRLEGVAQECELYALTETGADILPDHEEAIRDALQ